MFYGSECWVIMTDMRMLRWRFIKQVNGDMRQATEINWG